MSDDLSNLAAHVRARREARDWTQIDVWRNGGPSNSTLTAIEAGRPPAPSRATIRKLDAGLEWTPGSAREVLRGGSPTELEASEPAAVTEQPEVRESTLMFRRPDGLTDADWAKVQEDHRDYWEYLIDKAARQR